MTSTQSISRQIRLDSSLARITRKQSSGTLPLANKSEHSITRIWCLQQNTHRRAIKSQQPPMVPFKSGTAMMAACSWPSK